MRRRSLVDRAYEVVLRHVADGAWREGDKCPTARQLAGELKMSRLPVQMAYHRAEREGLLAIQPRGSTMVRSGAAAHAQEVLGQMPPRVPTCRLAVLIPDKYFPLTGAPFQRRLAQEVCSAAAQRGFEAVIVPTPPGNQAALARSLVRNYDAAFLEQMQPENLALVFHLTESRFPVLLFNRHIPGLQAPSLNTDDYGAARTLARIMTDHGHRNLCMLTTTHYESMLGDHGPAEGWLDYLQEARLTDGCVLPLAYGKKGRSVEVLEKLLALRPRITALVLYLPTLLADMREHPVLRRLRVPEELSIATTGSMNGIAVPSGFPPITSFEIDWNRAGRCAVELIDRMLAGEAQPKDLRVPLNLQLTDSIGPVPEAERRNETCPPAARCPP